MRVLVLDPQPIVREGVLAVLGTANEFQVVGSFGELRPAVLSAARTSPHVVVTDLELGAREGVAAITELRPHVVGGGVLVFTNLPSWRTIGRARSAGARGVVLKTEPPGTLLEAIRTVGQGGTYLSRSLPTDLREAVDRAPDALGVLSDREREVFHLVVRGMTNRRIGRELFISPKTVDSHRGRILDKLGCRSALELVRFAFVNELVPPSALADPVPHHAASSPDQNGAALVIHPVQ